MTQNEFRAKFPGIDVAFLCTKEHPMGNAPGSLMWLVSAGAISLKKVDHWPLPDEIVVHDADRVRSMIASLPKKDRDVEYALKESRGMTDEQITAAIIANRTAYEKRLQHERVRIFNEQNLIPIGGTDPYEVYEAAREALAFLTDIQLVDGPMEKSQAELIEKIRRALQPVKL